VIIIDELGRMELASAAFVSAVYDLLAQDVAVVATVHEARTPSVALALELSRVQWRS
jgi:nucleoside-triphosphatase THEP1